MANVTSASQSQTLLHAVKFKFEHPEAEKLIIHWTDVTPAFSHLLDTDV